MKLEVGVIAGSTAPTSQSPCLSLCAELKIAGLVVPGDSRTHGQAVLLQDQVSLDGVPVHQLAGFLFLLLLLKLLLHDDS